MAEHSSPLRWSKSGTASGRRLVEGLVSSGGRIAWIGLVASLVTLGFTLYLQGLLRWQTDFGAPLTRASRELESALSRSVAQLRGWVAYQDPAAKADRTRTWRELEEALHTLEQVSSMAKDVEVANRIETLQESLHRLQVLQWAVEDMAHEPGNRPAMAAYESRLEPLRRSVMELLRGPLELRDEGQVSRRVGRESLLRFRTLFVETDSALVGLLQSYSAASEANVREKLTNSEAVTHVLASALKSPPEGMRVLSTGVIDDSVSLLRSAVRDVRAYQELVDNVIALRKGPGADRARRLFRTRIRPELDRAVALSRSLAERQGNIQERHAAALYRASFVVLALALLMGGISGTSIWLSTRLESRVQTVLAKAKSLGQYRVLERIGGGGMGEVYLGQHDLLRRPCAIKLLRTERLRDPEAQDRFQREVQLTAQLHHPNTIAVFDYGKTPDGLFYYVMELLRGITLDTLVDLTGPVPPARAVHILTQVCSSLAEAHGKGLLHRDVKPSNVMLTELGGVYDVVKVLDFGLVAQVKAGQVADDGRAIVGTPMYLAPETIRVRGSASARSDIYAIGAVGYQLLTGTPLFELDRVEDVLRAQLETFPERPSERLGKPVPEDLEVLVLGCLAKDPDDRPESAAVLRDLLQQLDVPPWTSRDAELWWSTYGDAVLAESRARGANRTEPPSWGIAAAQTAEESA